MSITHGILTLRASPYIARSIPPIFSRKGVRVALLTITTTCDLRKGYGGATKHTHTNTDTKALLFKVQGYIGEALQGARA